MPRQQYTQPFTILVGIKIFQQLLITYMSVFIGVHKWKITNLYQLDANELVFHNE